MSRYCPRGRQASRRRLYRDRDNAVIAGVCSGIANYLGINTGFVRLVTVIIAFPFTMATLIAYFVLALALKRRPPHLYDDDEEERFWQAVRVEPSRTVGDLWRKFEDLEERLRNAEARVTSSSFKLERAFRDLEA